MSKYPAKFFSVQNNFGTKRALYCRTYNQKIENKLPEANFNLIFGLLWCWINNLLTDPEQIELVESLISIKERRNWRTINDIRQVLPSAVSEGMYIIDGNVSLDLILGGTVTTPQLPVDDPPLFGRGLPIHTRLI